MEVKEYRDGTKKHYVIHVPVTIDIAIRDKYREEQEKLWSLDAAKRLEFDTNYFTMLVYDETRDVWYSNVTITYDETVSNNQNQKEETNDI